jgi:release factor glutamine methyltransferase
MACDVGTGSGALAIALARAIPTAVLYAIDRSLEALEVARANALMAGVETVQFLHGDLLAPLPAPVDLIVANLPYLGTDEYAALSGDVALYEPRDALVGGTIGFELTALLLAQAPDHLRPGGTIVLEIGPGQAEGTTAAARAAFAASEILVESDYAGLTRYVQVISRP